MKRFHISISVNDIEKSVQDYSNRLNQVPCHVVPNEFALWRTDTLNFSIRKVSDCEPGHLRHVGWEDEHAETFTDEKDVNGIVWESFTAQQQADEINRSWATAYEVKPNAQLAFHKTLVDNLLNQKVISIFCKDLEGAYLFCNNKVLQMAGKKNHSEIIGKTDFDMPWHAVAEDVYKTDKAVCDSQQANVLNERGVLGDGSIGSYLSIKFPIYDKNSQVIGLMGIATDATETD